MKRGRSWASELEELGWAAMSSLVPILWQSFAGFAKRVMKVQGHLDISCKSCFRLLTVGLGRVLTCISTKAQGDAATLAIILILDGESEEIVL